MKKFDLWFPRPFRHSHDQEAETGIVFGQSAYIEVTNPYENGLGRRSGLNAKGRILLDHESISADECCRQIDSLISDLKELKAKARKKFLR